MKDASFTLYSRISLRALRSPRSRHAFAAARVELPEKPSRARLAFPGSCREASRSANSDSSSVLACKFHSPRSVMVYEFSGNPLLASVGKALDLFVPGMLVSY